MKPVKPLFVIVLVLSTRSLAMGAAAQPAPPEIRPWLEPQAWVRDCTGPVISLGEAGEWNDTHLFAPCVAFEDGTYTLWYCGSRSEVAERVFRVGRATSQDGVQFREDENNPVFEFGGGEDKRSILTPTLLRSPEGSVLREEGRLRMWFSAADLTQPGALHTLHESTSLDGITWSTPSEAQIDHVYSPTVLREKDGYRLWYTDVSEEPWKIRHGRSDDGRTWEVTPDPVIVIDQPWERGRLFYTTAVKAGNVYLLWYGAYNSERVNTTAIGFAASLDGIVWYKNPHNPVFRPDPNRAWESHYTTSQSILPLPGGGWRLWYATRKAPPFVNKYFAIGTAVWNREE